MSPARIVTNSQGAQSAMCPTSTKVCSCWQEMSTSRRTGSSRWITAGGIRCGYRGGRRACEVVLIGVGYDVDSFEEFVEGDMPKGFSWTLAVCVWP